jgi:hypothetical protein
MPLFAIQVFIYRPARLAGMIRYRDLYYESNIISPLQRERVG